MLAVVVGTRHRLPVSQAHVSMGNYRGEFSKAVGQGLLLLLFLFFFFQHEKNC